MHGSRSPDTDHSGRSPALAAPVSVPEFVQSLSDHAGSVALVAGGFEVTYAELLDRIDDAIDTLGADRRLIHVCGGNQIDTVVSHLAALRGGHAVLLTPATTAGIEIARHFGDGASVPLHPELAVAMPTSGSTGAARLVRLSGTNLHANARSIADVLHLDASDRAITSLPLHYSYGLSVLHSHLAVGASVVLTDASVVDDCFWDDVHRHGVTTLAGVPHTFDLLAAAGADRLSAPSLRLVTQAGGRMSTQRVLEQAAIAARHGHEFAVMYGQTEATARMTVLEPAFVASHPHSVGRAVPGGSIELRPHPAFGLPTPQTSETSGATLTGEIVYRGSNVMLGYATSPADLALGRTIDELHTGDIGRFDHDGFLEIVGRASRIVKPFGVRVDLDGFEHRLNAAGLSTVVTGDDDIIVVAPRSDPTTPHQSEPATRQAPVLEIARAVARGADIPERCLIVLPPGDVARLPNGKPDLAGLLATAHAAGSARVTGSSSSSTGTDNVASLYAQLIDRHRMFDHHLVRGDDTFVSLGGDSLSYVEVSIALESLLGHLPIGWHLRRVDELQQLERDRLDAGRRDGHLIRHVETGVLLRAVAIVLVVGTHMGVFWARGGAHALLAIAGFNLARFRLSAGEAQHRAGGWVRSIARIAVPTSAWIVFNMALVGGYSLGSAFLINNYTGSPWRRDARWNYWYLEVLVQMMVVLAVLTSIGPVRRLERRHPFAVASAFTAIMLVFRFGLVQFGDPYNAAFRTHTVGWCVAIGWMAARALTTRHRLIVSATILVAVPGFFGEVDRERLIIVAMLALVWVRQVPVPGVLMRPIGWLAAASLTIFLLHWHVWPQMLAWFPAWVAMVATMTASVAAWALGTALVPSCGRAVSRAVGRAVGRAVPARELAG